MDCTGSMGSYIQAAKQNIESIVHKLAAQQVDVRFGLVAYRDHPPQDSTYVSRVFPFTSDVSQMKRQLGELSARGGGDGPEAVEAGLLDTLNMAWRDDVTKVCILIADAPPHGLGESGDGFPDGAPTGVDPLVVLDQMSAKAIAIYAVGCQPALSHYRYATDFMIAAAERTNGVPVALGSAAALADLVMGGSLEEVDLQGLQNQLQEEVVQLMQAEPCIDEEEVQSRVWRQMQARGTKTRQVKASKLASARSALVSKACSLESAKSALHASGAGDHEEGYGKKAKPPAPEPRRAAPGPRKKSMARSSSPPRPCPARGEALRSAPPPAASCCVEVEEEAISMEQVERMFRRGKVQGAY